MAYDILSDSEKRRLYDMAGEQGIKGGRSEEQRVHSESEDDGEFSSDEEEIFFPRGHFRSFFTFNFSGSCGGGSFDRAREAFRKFSFHANFGQTHSFHAQSESESESDRDPHHHPSHSESESEPESGVYCDPRNIDSNSDPEPDIINISP